MARGAGAADTTYRTPLFLTELARAESVVGRHQLALTTIDEAIGWFNDQDDFWCAPECFRVKAEIRRRRGATGATGATAQPETLLRRAHPVAERQGAAVWQTRLELARAG